MGNESKCFDRAAPAAGFRVFEWQPEAASDCFADIGYEAADPSLQFPSWCEAMQAPPASPGSR